MSWVVWRQGRSENVLLLAVLGALALLLVLTGAHMRSVFDSTGLAACTNPATLPPSCSILVSGFESRFESLSQLAPWFGLSAGLIGVLLATPLVLELDQGTYRLAWTQSVTPRRWLQTRIGVLILGSIACGATLIAVGTWWRQPLDALSGRIGPDSFDLEGVLPIVYIVLSASVVLAVGTVTRRTGLAVAGGVGAYVVTRLLSGTLRQHLIPPIHALVPAPRGPSGIFYAWSISHTFTDARGHPIPTGVIVTCVNKPTNLSVRCLLSHHVYQSFVYEPASRFWALQGAQAGVLLALSATLLGLAVWWIKHRIA